MNNVLKAFMATTHNQPLLLKSLDIHQKGEEERVYGIVGDILKLTRGTDCETLPYYLLIPGVLTFYHIVSNA
jgi:hypothetical protein